MHNEFIHGDALAIIDSLGEFDYLITDPPYPSGSNAMSGSRTVDGARETREMMDSLGQSFFAGVFRGIRRRSPFRAWIFSDWRQVSFLGGILQREGLQHQACIVWDKETMGFGRPYRASYEMILYASDEPANEVTGNIRDVVSARRVPAKKRTHPFEKPPEIIEAICKNFPSGRAIDPFCGTGSLCIGASRINWDSVGVDISKRSIEIARQRMHENKNLKGDIFYEKQT